MNFKVILLSYYLYFLSFFNHRGFPHCSWFAKVVIPMFVRIFREHRDSSVHETSTGLSGAGWCGEPLLVVTARKPSFATDLAHVYLSHS
jgi:hypothetical protein